MLARRLTRRIRRPLHRNEWGTKLMPATGDLLKNHHRRRASGRPGRFGRGREANRWDISTMKCWPDAREAR